MNNELLEQWRKEAEELYQYGHVIETQRAYIEGCKATHEKMQKEVERLKMHLENYYRDDMRQFLQNRDIDEDIEVAIDRLWQQFKTNNNIS